MRDNIAFLELKFGNIYGGYANFFAISDIALLVFDPSTNRIFIESLAITSDVDVVWVNSKVNKLGHTIGRSKQVVNLKTRRKKPYKEEFSLNENDLDWAFKKIRPTRRYIKSFFGKNFRKYNLRNIVTFDGKRDLFLCEKSGVQFRGMRIFDLQKALNKEFNYLFSLNKLGVATDIRYDNSDGNLKSNNLKYWLHPIAARQLKPRSAAWDAARMFMVYQEFNEHHDDFTMKSALLVNQIQAQKEAETPAPKPVEKTKPAETAKEKTDAVVAETVSADTTAVAETVSAETVSAETVSTETVSTETVSTETVPAVEEVISEEVPTSNDGDAVE